MPSPVAHSLAGLALAQFTRSMECGKNNGLVPPRVARLLRYDYVILGALIFAANAADLDFVPGLLIGDPGRFHHGPVHSLGAAVIFGVAAGHLAYRAGVRAARPFGVLMGLAFASHLALDMLSSDYGIRNGVPLLWPFSRHRFVLPFAVFLDIRHESIHGDFLGSLLVRHNLYAMWRELEVVSAAWAAVWIGVLVLRRARRAWDQPDLL